MNRLSNLFGKPCKCCREKRRLARLKAECKRIEVLIGDVAEFIIPTIGKRKRPGLFFTADFEVSQRGDDLRLYAERELRRVGLALLAAADRLEGGQA